MPLALFIEYSGTVSGSTQPIRWPETPPGRPASWPRRVTAGQGQLGRLAARHWNLVEHCDINEPTGGPLHGFCGRRGGLSIRRAWTLPPFLGLGAEAVVDGGALLVWAERSTRHRVRDRIRG